VWVEIPVHDNYSLLTGNHYFPPDCDVKITEDHLNFLEHNLSTHLYRVIGQMALRYQIVIITAKLKII
jgi:hypothetical protein